MQVIPEIAISAIKEIALSIARSHSQINLPFLTCFKKLELKITQAIMASTVQKETEISFLILFGIKILGKHLINIFQLVTNASKKDKR